MNYQIIRLLQRIAAETASTAVYMLFNNYRKQNNYSQHSQRYKGTKRSQYFSADRQTKRPYVPKEKPYKSLAEQTQERVNVQQKTKKLNGK